jgi:5-enolpyruvylshikimate-3-phosphate synthase
MAMAFSILGLNSENGIKITNADVVEKSWANYWDELIQLKVKSDALNVVEVLKEADTSTKV